MLGPFGFEHGGRKYTCQAETREGLEGERWWFSVSGDGNRYAPFPVTSRDTRASIQARIVAYYTNHLARRAEPPAQHWAQKGRGSPGRPKGSGAAVVAAKVDLPAGK